MLWKDLSVPILFLLVYVSLSLGTHEVSSFAPLHPHCYHVPPHHRPIATGPSSCGLELRVNPNVSSLNCMMHHHSDIKPISHTLV